MYNRLFRSSVFFLCLIAAAIIFIASPVIANGTPEINLEQGSIDISDGGSFDFGCKQVNSKNDITMTITDDEVPIETDPQGEVQHTYIITSEDGVLNITIPEGTTACDCDGNPLNLITAAVVTDPPPPPPGVNIVGPVFSLGPSGATFDPSITITFTYDPVDIPADVAEADLKLAFYNDTTGEWLVLECTIDTENNIIIAQTSHFSDFTIISGVPLPPLPSPSLISLLLLLKVNPRKR